MKLRKREPKKKPRDEDREKWLILSRSFLSRTDSVSTAPNRGQMAAGNLDGGDGRSLRCARPLVQGRYRIKSIWMIRANRF